MNYYERHLGDYARDTSHLSMLEHGAYNLLLDRYYATETGIPEDKAHRLACARSRDERAAVDMVLSEFFTLRDGIWQHKRVDEIIEAYQAGGADREAKKNNENARLARHREERARLFEVLRCNGVHADWNIKMKELQELVTRTCNKDLPLPETQPATAPATLATAIQEPITSNQSPDTKGLKPVGAAEPRPARGSRLPADWVLSPELAEWAMTERPGFPVVLEAAKFRDHWNAKPGQGGVKSDWDATWRNWVRNARFIAAVPARHGDFDKRDYSEGVGADGRF